MQGQDPLEQFIPSGNEFFDSHIIAKMNQHTLFWKENTDGVNFLAPKRLEREIKTLKFLSGLYSAIKKSGKTYEGYSKEIPNFESMFEEEFRLTESGLGWPGEMKDEFLNINK